MWRQLLLSAATLTTALANEHDRDREREREGDFRELGGEGRTWWIWGVVGLVFILCVLGLCGAMFYDWKSDEDGYEHGPDATAYAHSETRPFPIMPAKRSHSKKHRKHRHGSKRTNMAIPFFSDMSFRSPVVAV